MGAKINAKSGRQRANEPARDAGKAEAYACFLSVALLVRRNLLREQR